MKKMSLILLTLFVMIPEAHAKSRFTQMAEKYKNVSPEYYQKNLTKEVHKICRQKGTESAFSHPYDKLYDKGTYMCACCGGDFPLYKSDAKYDSKTGWPSFWAPIDGHIGFKEDRGFFTTRTEVVCARCGSHIGHVFDDGPEDKGGKRYCMNGLALTFVKEGEKPTRSFEEPK